MSIATFLGIIGVIVVVILIIGLLLAYNIWETIQSNKTADRIEQRRFNDNLVQQVHTIRNIVEEQGKIQVSLDSSISILRSTIDNLKAWIEKVSGEQEILKRDIDRLKGSNDNGSKN